MGAKATLPITTVLLGHDPGGTLRVFIKRNVQSFLLFSDQDTVEGYDWRRSDKPWGIPELRLGRIDS